MASSVESFPGREISINGIPHLYFGGTSYLGLQTDAQFQALFVKSIKKYGTNYGASRKSNIQLSIFKTVEQHLATVVGSQDCITMSSGFLAGQLVAQTMNTKQHEFFYAPDTHSALHISGNHHFSSFKDLNSAVRAHLEKYESTPIIFLDSMDTLRQNYPDFKEVKELPLDQIILVVDDSHGIGIIGNNGSGAYQSLRELQPKELIVCCSLGKGFGIQAGAIFGKRQRIAEFTNTDFFGGASPAAPAALSLLLQAEKIIENKRIILQQHIGLFKNQVKRISQFTSVPNYSVFGFSNTKLAAHLEAHQIIITNFNYPTKNAALMSRIVLSAQHTKEDIKHLIAVINTL